MTPTVTIESSQDRKGYKVFFEHECTPHEGNRKYSLPGSIWFVQSFEPITIAPSISCGLCKIHGWFKDGKWIPLGS